MRLRFAPSPTGRLHLGNARTAVFNHLLARSVNGTLVLRVDDTDTARNNPESERELFTILRRLGITWSEGPDVGGPFAPYRQSGCLELYRDAAARLIADGRAYPCFCRHPDALPDGEEPSVRTPHDDRACRERTRGEVDDRIARGEPYALRFALSADETALFQDAVKGEIAFTREGLGGDFVILRSDGVATYNLATVVDDARMKISLVLRGEDHLSNTGKQVLLYRALGLPIPDFAHVPTVLGPDHRKLSKRHGATTLSELFDRGFLPEAVLNALALLGFNPKDGREFMTPAELIEAFQMGGLSSSASIFDEGKLAWLNERHLHRLTDDELIDRAGPFRPDPLPSDLPPSFDWRAALLAERAGLKTLGDLPALIDAFRFIPSPEAEIALREPEREPILRAMVETLQGTPSLTETAWTEAVGKVRTLFPKDKKRVFETLRLALTGREHGPELKRLAPVLGLDEVTNRLDRWR